MGPLLNRRRFLGSLLALGVSARLPRAFAQPAPIARAIPATGESLPVIGMGTWRTFNVGSDPGLIEDRTRILELFFDRGGAVVDSSPMYGSAEAVVGKAMIKLGRYNDLFSATKVWTGDEDSTRDEVRISGNLWGVETFDLMQIHNLLGWEGHLANLKAMKAEGRIRYLGITTSHGRRHAELKTIMEREPLDFVQLTYNILDREAEQQLLPLARERGIAIIANRPFQGGRLFGRFHSEPLPEWAAEAGCQNWAEFFLKFIVSHPDVTCAIPATTQLEHMRENMGALYGRLPDPAQRQRMIDYVESL
ncbi:aldo/keto reductase [Marinobacter sp. JSM 1782161]|uniref:aldo/keto reductase n=1 Tax=Marinobacter sp. JSM 1782161 TaxID=2685906 RepID=UPI001403C4F1|nr:aldo/keto reductase [Marinobacter sp. JSM 1782161]